MKPSTLFFMGCIPVRILLAYLVYITLNDSFYQLYKSHLASIIFTIGLSFMIIYIMGWRQTGFEAGGKIWWNNLRPIHSIIYLLTAVGMLFNIKNIYVLLLLDVLIGIYAELKIKQN